MVLIAVLFCASVSLIMVFMNMDACVVTSSRGAGLSIDMGLFYRRMRNKDRRLLCIEAGVYCFELIFVCKCIAF